MSFVYGNPEPKTKTLHGHPLFGWLLSKGTQTPPHPNKKKKVKGTTGPASEGILPCEGIAGSGGLCLNAVVAQPL